VSTTAAATDPGQLTASARGPRPGAHALTTRFADFWLLGGASILVWLVMIVAQGFRASWAVDQHFRNLTITAASLSLLVNYPHFLISYKLAYGRGRAFVTMYWWQLIVVPIALAGLFAAAFFGTTSRSRICRSSRARPGRWPRGAPTRRSCQGPVSATCSSRLPST
jgi:hypothetical protein